MKKKDILQLIASFLIFSIFISCTNKKQEYVPTNNKEIINKETPEVQYVADIKKSNIFWKGFKLTGEHEGILNLKKGVLNVSGEKIVGGQFVFDMNSISSTDLKGKRKESLDSHLKDGDFFEVTNYPTSKFVITNLKKTDSLYMANGNLTIKDSTHNILFKVKITENDSMITINSTPFFIDRTKWGIMYKSKQILTDLKNGYIKDQMEIIIDLHINK